MTLPLNYPDHGLAQFQTDDVDALNELFGGDTPAPVTIAGTYTAAQATAGIPRFTPVRVDYDGGPITVVDGTNTKANALTIVPLLPGGLVAGSLAVMKAACLNLKGPINWPSAANTETLRLQVFDLGSSQLYVKRPVY